jgi:hypothetical protein
MTASRALLGLSLAGVATLAGAGTSDFFLWTPLKLEMPQVLTMKQPSPPMATTSL